MNRTPIVGIVAAGIGILMSHYLLNGAVTSLIPWTILGLGVGWVSRTYKEALLGGALFGFLVSFAFMMIGYNGAASRPSRVLPFSILGLFGAVCGIILSLGCCFIPTKRRNS